MAIGEARRCVGRVVSKGRLTVHWQQLWTLGLLAPLADFVRGEDDLAGGEGNSVKPIRELTVLDIIPFAVLAAIIGLLALNAAIN